MVLNEDIEKGLKHSKQILAALDDLLANRPWDKTIFLRAIAMQLKQIRNDYAEAISSYEAMVNVDPKKKIAYLQQEETEKTVNVYIHLYNLEGDNISKWEMLITNLEQQIVSRPVYRFENDVREVMRAKKGDLKNEAYAAISIHEKKLIVSSNDQIQRDKLGHELVGVKERAIDLSNFKYFIHKSGRYNLKGFKLIREVDVNLNENVGLLT